MHYRKCFWKGCREKVKLDVSIEERQTLFTVAGWCKLHHRAHSIYTELEKKFCKSNKLDWPPTFRTYEDNKTALNQLRELAEHRAKEENHGNV